jgi:hypothetical protein
MNIKLFGKDDPFVVLFKNELSLPGSGPLQVEEDPSLFQAPCLDDRDHPVLDDDGRPLLLTSVLDREGNPVKPFARCKHMFIFKNLYAQKRKLVGKAYVTQREVIAGTEYDNALPAMKKEKELLTGLLKETRGKYKTCLDRYESLIRKQDQAKSLEDTSARSALTVAKRSLEASYKAYTELLTANNLPYKIKL